MIVFRIVPVHSFAHEPDEKVSVNTFIVMQRYEVKVVKAQNGGNQNDPDHAELPDAFRDVLSRHATLRFIGFGGMSLPSSLLATT